MKKLLIYVLLASFAFGQGQVLQEASVAQAAAGTAGAGYYISPRRQGGGTGSPGTVTSVSVTPTATVTGTVTNASTTPALELTAITNPSPSGSNLVAGGSVAFVSNLTLTVAAATYVIQGVQYSSPITTLTASAADPTFDRIDIVAVNSSGAAVLIEGTPAASPVAPDVDPASQLGLTFYILSAGATSIPVSVTDIYHNNAEWTMSRSGTTWTLASTNNPYTGSVCIEGTAVATGNSFTATAPSDIDLADHDNLIFYIRNKAAWPSTRQISIQWLNNSNVVKGTVVTLKNGSYGFNALTNTTAYQQIAIPLSAFGANGLAVRKLRFQLAGTGATIGAYVDDITLQGGLAPVVDTTKMQWRGSYNASNLYNINDVVISSGIQYVAIAAGVGHTPVSSPTFWQPSTASTGGTVTTITSTPAEGVTLNITNPTTTPNITVDLGNITPDSVTTTGIDSSAGAQVEVANALAALAIDVTKGLNTKTIAADSTFTFSGTPANSNQGFTLRLTNSDTNNHVITIPSTFDANAQATTTSFTILAGGIETITWVYNGSTYIGYNVPSPAYSAEITVASATTTNIGAAASVNVAISGTTAITGFGTVAAGTYRQGRFTGILTFTHNGTSLILPNAGSNITTAANDRFGAYSLGSGNWLVLWYQRADGTALAGSGGFSSTTTATTLQNAEQITLSSSGTATFVGTAGVTAISYSTGTHYTFTSNFANSGAASMNINGLGAKTIVKVAGGVTTALAANDIRSGQVCDIAYDGTNFQLQSTLGNAPSGSGTVTVSGSPANTYVPYWTTATNISGDSGFTYSGNQAILSGTTGPSLIQRATSSTGAAEHRIYNDQNTGTRSLTATYTGSSFSGSYVTGSPTGEIGAIGTAGAFPFVLYGNNLFSAMVSTGGRFLVGKTTDNGGESLQVSGASNAGISIDTVSGFPYFQFYRGGVAKTGIVIAATANDYINGTVQDDTAIRSNASKSFIFSTDNGSTGNFQILAANAGIRTLAGNMFLGTSGAAGTSAANVLVIANGTIPGSSPSGVGQIYVESGAGKYRGSSGTITTFGAADPHCPICGTDFVHEWENDKYGYLAVCMNCFANGVSSKTRVKGAWKTHD